MAFFYSRDLETLFDLSTVQLQYTIAVEIVVPQSEATIRRGKRRTFSPGEAFLLGVAAALRTLRMEFPYVKTVVHHVEHLFAHLQATEAHLHPFPLTLPSYTPLSEPGCPEGLDYFLTLYTRPEDAALLLNLHVVTPAGELLHDPQVWRLESDQVAPSHILTPYEWQRYRTALGVNLSAISRRLATFLETHPNQQGAPSEEPTTAP